MLGRFFLLFAMLWVVAHGNSLIAAPVERDPFSELPEVLDPKQDRTERDFNLVEATSLLTYARLLEQRNQPEKAIQQYQRAYRLSPDTTGILKDILRMESQLQRAAEGTRYMLLLSDHENELNAKQRISLAAFAVQQDQPKRAIALLKQAVKTLDPQKNIAELLGVHLRLMELYSSQNMHSAAALQAAKVRDLLANGSANGLKETIESFSDKNFYSTYVMMANLFVAAKQYDEAEAMYRLADKHLSIQGVLDLQLAELSLHQNNKKVAKQHLDQYLEPNLSVGGRQAYVLLQRLTQLQTQDEAQTREQLIHQLRPLYDAQNKNASLGYFLAELYAKDGNWDEALQLVASHQDKSKSSIGKRLLISAAHHEKDWSALTDALEDALSPQFDLSRAKSESQKLIDDTAGFEQLIKHVEQQLSQGKGISSLAAVAIARLYELKQDHNATWKWMQRGAAADEEKLASQILMTWALDIFPSDQLGHAEKALLAAINYKPPKQQRALLYFYLATVQQFLEKNDEALASAKKAVSLEDKSPLLQSRVPWVYYQSGELDQSVRYYKRLLASFDKDRQDPQTREVVKEAKSILSNIAVKQGDLPQAEQWLEQILDEFPEEVGTQNDLGYLWVDQNKNLQRSLRMIGNAVKAEPENMAYRDSLGWAYYQLGDYQNSVTQIEKAIELSEEPDAVVLDHLANAYLKLDRKQDAIKTWGQAADLFKAEKEHDKEKSIRKKIIDLTNQAAMK
ncbi:MAG: tetratricopeptide repeat protein [Pirellulales bacterium]